jgi:hypothetical protein
MSALTHRRALLATTIGLVAALALATAGLASKKRMHSTKIGPNLCETSYGGKFVDIPGFPGEKLDRRLLTDVKYLQRKYKIFVTDGYSMSDVHASNGEHPIGLALDIVPDKANGGRWRDIDRLAKWAEPRQNHPREPFRWVGYDGDANHGRNHHLHLSWSHSDTKPGRPAMTVYTLRCPGVLPPVPPVGNKPHGGHGGHKPGNRNPDSGGTVGNGNGSTSGGFGKRLGRVAPPVAERDGVDLGE